MPVALPLMPVIVAMFLLLLVFTWDKTIGPILNALADAVDLTISLPGRLPDISLGQLARAIRSASSAVRHKLGELFEVAAWPLVALLTLARTTLLAPARELAYLSRDVAAAVYGLRHTVIPAMIAAKVAWIPRHLAALAAQVAALAARAPVHIVKQIEHATATTTKVIVNKAVALPWPRIRTLEREVDALKKRGRSIVKRVPVALTAAALTALVARTSFRWIRCSRVNRVGKQVCGMDTGMLDSLIADTLLIAGTISLVEFAEGLGAGMAEFAPQVRKFWKVV